MSAWIVYSKDGTTERCRLKKLEYSGSFMNERTVTVTFECESEVAFDVFDYIEYRGEKFELEAIPSVKKTSSHNYEYELRFVSLKYELERCEMRDIVPNDNGIVYPTPLTFSFTGDVAYLAERIQANLDALYGKGVWSIVVAEGVTSEDKNITISQQNCWNALSLVNTTYELDFTVKGRIVTIGGNKPSISHIFQYGKGKGLYEIERSADTETGIVTKLRAYGGTKNLDYSYPKKPEWSDSVLDTSFVLSPLRLMLPSFKKDGKTDYIMADDSLVAKYGIREASVIYEDIYPSITGATNSKGEAIDEIKAVDDIDDSKSTFVIHLHELGFDLEENLTTANAQVSMKTGAMQGYTFNIADNGIERLDDGSYKLTLGRITANSSDTDNFDIPNSKWNMKAGDKFVLLNILMPQEYIREAENRLLERAKEYLAEYGKTNFSYNVGLHDKFLVENSDVYSSLVEGAKLTIYDAVLGISEDVTIQSITITENADDNILPQVKITLNNNPSASTLDRIQGQIKELSETTSGSFSSQSELLKQYRKKLDKPFFDRLFVAVGLDGKELASTDTNSPIAYIKAKYSFATIGGVTMYAQDGNMDIPTIAEGLPFDNRTIWFNPATGQIEVIGGTGGGTGGGATTLGSLANVGSWADSVASQDRIMYQAANSSQWVAKNLSDLAVGGVTGDYLPLNMTSTPFVVNTQSGVVNFKSTSSSEVGFRLYFGDSNKGGLWANDERIYLYHAPTGNSIDLTTGGRLIFKAGGVDYTVLHSDNYDNYALPLSGGTLTGTLAIINKDVALCLYRQQNNATPYIRFAKNATTQYGELGVYNDGRLVFWPLVSSQGGYGQWNTVWHSGNDGSGSGLDADMLDGVHLSKDQKPYGKIPLIGADGVMEAGKYIDFHNDNTTGSDFSTRLICAGEFANKVSLPSASGTLALTTSNVASATKLQTARTIWGQSFDGTGNVDGALSTAHNNFFISADGGNTQLLGYSQKDGYYSLGYSAGVNGITTHIYGGEVYIYGGMTKVMAVGSSGLVGIYTNNQWLSPAKIMIGRANTQVYSDWANIGVTDGNLHLDSYNGKSVYINYYSNTNSQGLVVGGGILTTGGVTMYSDARKKTILNHVVLSLQQVAEAPLIEHYYNSDQNKTTHVGSIAQYWAGLNDWFCKKDSEGYYTMEIQNAALASAISVARELVKFETETDRRIRLLEDENKRLKEEVEQLKWNIA